MRAGQPLSVVGWFGGCGFDMYWVCVRLGLADRFVFVLLWLRACYSAQCKLSLPIISASDESACVGLCRFYFSLSLSSVFCPCFVALYLGVPCVERALLWRGKRYAV